MKSVDKLIEGNNHCPINFAGLKPQVPKPIALLLSIFYTIPIFAII